MTYCEAVAIRLYLAWLPMDQIRAIYKKIPDPHYDFHQPETHIRKYLQEKVKNVRAN